MDPVTAVAQMITALANAYIAALAATPLAEQKTIIDWYIADTQKIRKFFKID
jgi:hypothetical protein